MMMQSLQQWPPSSLDMDHQHVAHILNSSPLPMLRFMDHAHNHLLCGPCTEVSIVPNTSSECLKSKCLRLTPKIICVNRAFARRSLGDLLREATH